MISLATAFEATAHPLGMTQSSSSTNATQLDVPELELLSPQVSPSLLSGLDLNTGISPSHAFSLTVEEDMMPDLSNVHLLIPDTGQVTAGIDEPQDVVLFGGQRRKHREQTPPVIVARMRDDLDGVTSNPLIEGTVTDDSRIIKFSARFDGTPKRHYRNLRGLLEPNGTFSLDANRLRLLNRNRPLTEGQHTLNLRAKDQWNNLSQVDLTFTVDTTKPRLIAGLVEDTGSSQSDQITASALIGGQIIDSSAIASFKAGFDTTPLSNFVDVTPLLRADQTFILDSSVLKQINGHTELSQGQHTLKLLATDKAGNTSDPISYTFTLDTIAPTRPNFALDTTFDAAPIGDSRTTFTNVGLSGQTEGNIQVTLVGTGQETIASATGQFSFTEVALALGDNPLAVQAMDLAGNISQFSTVIERVTDTNSDVVIDWNATLLRAIRTAQTAPPLASRNMAMVHAAIYDSVNGITGSYNPYFVNQTAPIGASPEAAAAAAAHRVLINLYPNQQATFDVALTASLADLTDGPSEDAGVAYGHSVADAILLERSTDGSNQTVNYTSGTEPGDWQPTPPNFAPPLYPSWGSVTPFAMTDGSQFRPDGPPALDSQEYATDYNQVKALGKIDSSTRTADQTEIAQFWADGTGTFTPPGHWNQIAEQLSATPGRSLIENARLFALLNIGLADAGIACWDSKYTYNFWRPVTAIHSGDNDGNPQTLGEPNWTPLLTTPPFPEYVSGHSTFSGVGSTILAGLLGDEISFSTSSLGLPGIKRSFESFTDAAEEAGISRIYGGIHFLGANKDGLATGRALGTYVLQNFLSKEDEILTVMPGQSLEISLDSIIPNSTNATFSLVDEEQLPTGQFSGDGTLIFNPTGDEIGTYPFSIIVSQDGQQTLHEFTLQVIADPVTTTRISGVIENTQQQPLFGVIIELGNLQTTTDANGAFTIETLGSLPSDTLKVRGEAITGNITYPFIAEKLPLLFGRDPIESVNNVISRPIYLPPIDTTNAVTINPTVDTTVTSEAIDGASVFVAAGSLLNQEGELYTGGMSITEVPRDLTPAALPPNLLPDLVVTIQPGEMVFSTPAPLSLPNLAGYAPGTQMDLWSINPTTGLFDNVGTGEVSADGSVIQTISGGIHNSSWHFFTPPPSPAPDNPNDNDYNEETGCFDCSKTTAPATSEVELHSGAVIETHELVDYQSLGVNRGLTLTYDSVRADPRPILHFGYSNQVLDSDRRLVAELTVSRGNFQYQLPGWSGGMGLDGGEHIWSLPSEGSRIDAALQADLRSLASGRYDYQLTTGLLSLSNDLFNGATSLSNGKLLHVNSIGSPFGSGWGVAGWQELVENPDGSVLLIDGDGSELLFEAPNEAGEVYISPAGDFSSLEKLTDGTWSRTLKDLTVYTFNASYQLEKVKDRNGNETRYVYNSTSQLIKIVDPVGLETLFTYTGDLVTTITDPTERVTQLQYDGDGNLKGIIDPDGSSRTWGYDSDHHIITEIDQQGRKEQMFYDFAGRADRAIRSDGSELDFNPVQVQGLYPPSQTTNPANAPVAYELSEVPISTYLDANGNLTTTVLDQAGQTLTATDEIGLLPVFERNEDNLVTTRTDSRGHQTEYSYDEQSNLTQIIEFLPFPFQSFQEYSFNVSPMALAIGDLNGDQNLDLVTAHDYYQSGVFLLPGFGDGTFTNPTQLTNLSLTTLALGDLNHDGHLDLVTATENDISVWFGQRDGTLGEPTKTVIDHDLTDLVLGDFNGDGTLDAVVAGRSVALFLGTGNGTFTAAAQTDDLVGGELQLDHLDLESADLDEDGYLDLAIAVTGTGYGSDEAHLVLFFGQGDGTLEEKVDYEVNTELAAVGVGDLDGDGDLDLVTSHPEDDSVSVWSNQGNRSFILSTVKTVGRYPDDLVIGDVNSDAHLDVIVANQGSDTVSVLLGNGSGTLATQTEVSVGHTPTQVRLADLDADGDLDLISTSSQSSSNVSVSLNGDQFAPVARHYTYDPVFNQLTGEIDELGRQTLYEIDPNNGNLLSVTRVVGPLGGADDVVTHYTYTVSGLIDTETDPLGRVTDYDYDALGRLSEVTSALGTTDEASVQYEYDEAGNQTAVIDQKGDRTEYKYDALNRVVKTIYAVGTTDEATEEVEYDGAGNQTAVIDENSHRTEYVYDKLNRLVKTIAPDPDGTGPLTSPITTFTYDAMGNLLSMVDPLLRETKYVYDSRGRLLETIYPNGGVEKSEYDLDNHQTSSWDALGNRTNRVYDVRGRLILETDELGQRTRFVYDAANQLVATIDALGNRTQYQYDELGRQMAVIDAKGNITKTEYDKVGNVITTVAPKGQITQYTYDALNRQTLVTDALGGMTLTEYDLVGNVVSVTDSIGNTTTFAYDARYRLTSETNQLGKDRSFTYDDVGNQITATDRNGRVRTFTYDAQDRQIAEIWLDEAGNPIRTIASTYDAAGQLTSFSDPDSTYDLTYDDNGRLITVDNTDTPGSLPDVVLTYTYSQNGNLQQVSETIDGQTGGTTAYTYDELDRVVKMTQTGNNVASKRVDFTYDAIGQYNSINRYADTDGTQLVVESNYTFDALNRLENLTQSNTTSTVAFYDFVYDGASRITQISDLDGTTDYAYDDRSQLLEADHSDLNNPDEVYSYDANGNRTLTGYVTGENNRLESDGQYNYEYDSEGNLSRQTEMATGKVRELEWDWRNRLVAVVDQDNAGNVLQEVTFTYDAMNRRIAKTVDTTPLDAVDGAVTYFVYDRENVMLELVDNDGAAGINSPVLSTRYLHGTRVDEILAQEDSAGDVLWHLTDHLGTVRDLVDSSGTVVNHFTYDSYGNVISETLPAIDTRYLFTGREFDTEIGLYYYRARYYEAEVGRFLSEDPLGFEGGDENLYAYVANSPVDTVDPLGLYGLVLSQSRLIFYENNGRDFTNNIQEVIEAHKRNPNVSIKFDNTLASIRFFKSNTGSEANRRINPPGRRPLLDDRGHIVGQQLGGTGDDINNLFAQTIVSNRGSWRTYETKVRKYLDSRNTDPHCPPVNLFYSVNLAYVSVPFVFPLRPINVGGTAIFSDGHVETKLVLNP